MPKYYAVKVGKIPGVYTSWTECQTQVNGFPGAVFKSFVTLRDANDFVNQKSTTSSTSSTVILRRELVINTDGGCTGNGYAGSRAGIGIVVPATNRYREEHGISERVPVWNGRPESNQRAELFAVVRVFEELFTPNTVLSERVVDSDGSLLPIVIRTDSQYTINSFTTWCKAWRAGKWKKELENKDLVKYGLWLIETFKSEGGSVEFRYVKGILEILETTVPTNWRNRVNL